MLKDNETQAKEPNHTERRCFLCIVIFFSKRKKNTKGRNKQETTLFCNIAASGTASGQEMAGTQKPHTHTHARTCVLALRCVCVQRFDSPWGVHRNRLCATPVECLRTPEQAQKDFSPEKINATSKSPVGDISVVTLIRTDTTLDHSQKAEKVC